MVRVDIRVSKFGEKCLQNLPAHVAVTERRNKKWLDHQQYSDTSANEDNSFRNHIR